MEQCIIIVLTWARSVLVDPYIHACILYMWGALLLFFIRRKIA